MNKNTKLTIVLVVCFALLFGLGIMKLLIPKYNDISKRADANEAAASAANAKLDLARGLNPKSIETDLNKLRARVPSSIELANVILKINESANASKLVWQEGTPEDITITADAPAAGTETSFLNNHEVSIKVSGDINDLILFLESITNKSVGRIVVLTSVSINPLLGVDGLASANLVEADIKMNLIGWVDGANIDTLGCIEDPSKPGTECVLDASGN